MGWSQSLRKTAGRAGGLYLGLNAAAFSSYGSEKRGSPVKSYVRWSAPEREILHNSPMERLNTKRKVIAAAVNRCYFPLYEVKQGHTSLSFDPEAQNKKFPLQTGLT